MCVIFVIWSAFAPLDVIVRGDGRIVPTIRNQIIQNLEGGIVNNIYVTEGDVVEAGQLLATMDKTRFQSAYLELLDQQWALSLRLARLEAEADFENEFVPNPELARLAPEHAASEAQLYLARRAEIKQTKSNLSRAVELKKEEVDMLRTMAAREAIPQIEFIRAEQALVEIKLRLATVLTEFERTRSQEFADTLREMRQIEEQVRSREDQLLRTDVRSPIHGVVNRVMATTIGGVIQSGDPLLEVISLEEKLRVEGRVDPNDIGVVYVGMPATVKLTAFDFTIYGTLKGTVVHVGADTVIEERASNPTPYFEVFIELDTTTLEGPDGHVRIRPGMLTQIELNSGQRTVLQYILKPLFKTTEALSER